MVPLELATRLDAEHDRRVERPGQLAPGGRTDQLPGCGRATRPPTDRGGWTWQTDPTQDTLDASPTRTPWSRRHAWFINAFAWSRVLGGR